MVTLCDPSLNWFKNAFGLISLDLPILNLKWEKVMDVPNFLVEGLSAGIMGLGSHISF